MDNDKNITFVSGNIFASRMQALVNPVNCVGVMGAGLAKKFRLEFPEMFAEYAQRCKEHQVKIGRPYLWMGGEPSKHRVLNFPTKDHWRNPSKVSWIEEGLNFLLDHYKEWKIDSLAFPALGCDLGGLSWIDVKPLFAHHLSRLDIPVEIYVPKLTRPEKAIELIIEKLKAFGALDNTSLFIGRAVIPSSDGWMDFKSCERFTVFISSPTPLDMNKLDEIKSVARKSTKLEIEIRQIEPE